MLFKGEEGEGCCCISLALAWVEVTLGWVGLLSTWSLGYVVGTAVVCMTRRRCPSREGKATAVYLLCWLVLKLGQTGWGYFLSGNRVRGCMFVYVCLWLFGIRKHFMP